MPNPVKISADDVQHAPEVLTAVEAMATNTAALVSALDAVGWDIPGGGDLVASANAFRAAAKRELDGMVNAASGLKHKQAGKYQAA